MYREQKNSHHTGVEVHLSSCGRTVIEETLGCFDTLVKNPLIVSGTRACVWFLYKPWCFSRSGMVNEWPLCHQSRLLPWWQMSVMITASLLMNLDMVSGSSPAKPCRQPPPVIWSCHLRWIVPGISDWTWRKRLSCLLKVPQLVRAEPGFGLRSVCVARKPVLS